MGRIDNYPIDEVVQEAVKMMAGKFSPVMTQGMIEGLQKLGHTLVKVSKPVGLER